MEEKKNWIAGALSQFQQDRFQQLTDGRADPEMPPLPPRSGPSQQPPGNIEDCKYGSKFYGHV